MPDRDHYQHPENHREEPFHVFGELYFIGDDHVCAYLLDSGEGLILIDTGYPTGQALLIDSIYRLGFDPRNVRMILHTHGHFDHFGCTALIKSLSGARTYLSRADNRLLRERPEMAETKSMAPYGQIDPLEADEELSEGDEFSLGTVRIKVVETPGHTDGVLTFFIELHENGQTKTAGLFGGVGLNTMKSRYYALRGVSGNREKFRASISKLRAFSPDITLANHNSQGSFMKNHRTGSGFVHPEQWQLFLDECAQKLDQLEAEDPI